MIHDLQDAVRDRASGIIYMDYPDVKSETKLISKILKMPEGVVRPFCDVIATCRKSKSVDHELTRSPSTRALLDWIEYSQVIGVVNAYEITIKNRYGTTEDERSIFDTHARSKNIKSFSLKLPKSTYGSKTTTSTTTSKKSKTKTAKTTRPKAKSSKSDGIHDLGSLWSK